MQWIIAAAWYWTRMLPITKSIPKELLPIGSKPVIQYIVEGLAGAGVKDIVVITSQGKESIDHYFDKNYELEEVLKKKWKYDLLEEINKPKNLANLMFVKQKEQLWFAHALLSAKPWISTEYFVLSVGDTVFSPEIFQDLLAEFDKRKAPIILLQEIDRNDVSRYGVVEIKDGRIVNMVEKPRLEDAPSNFIMPWVYILPKSIFELIETLEVDPKHNEILLPGALFELAKEQPLYGHLTKHKIRDVGNPELWLKANVEILNLL